MCVQPVALEIFAVRPRKCLFLKVSKPPFSQVDFCMSKLLVELLIHAYHKVTFKTQKQKKQNKNPLREKNPKKSYNFSKESFSIFQKTETQEVTFLARKNNNDNKHF